MKFWLKTAALLLAVWLVGAVAFHFAGASRPTVASVTAYARSVDLDTLGGSERARAISRMEDMVNHITFGERQRFAGSRVDRQFFLKLTPAEQDAYLDATLPSGFQQMMDSFNKMDPATRKRMLTGALNEMKAHGGRSLLGPDDKVAQHVLDQGVKSYFKDANADVKLDLAPLMEQMQHDLQRP